MACRASVGVGQQRRTVQRPAQGLGEVGVGHRVGRRHVHGPGQVVVSTGHGGWPPPRRRGRPSSATGLPRPQPSADAELEREQQLAQGATLARSGRSRCAGGRPGCRRPPRARSPPPTPHHLGQEARARAARLGQLLVAPVARSSRPPSPTRAPRAAGRARPASGQQRRALDPAVPDGGLVVVGPPVVADAGAGQVDDRVVAFEGGGVDGPPPGVPAASPAAVGEPRTRRVTWWPSRSRLDDGAADEPVRAGDDDPHGGAAALRQAATCRDLWITWSMIP